MNTAIVIRNRRGRLSTAMVLMMFCLSATSAPSWAQNDTPTPTDTRTLQVFGLQHTSAEQLASIIPTVFQTDGMRLTIDPRTNGLIVYATTEQHQQIMQLIETVDVPARRVDEREFNPFHLRHSDAHEVAAIVSSALQHDGVQVVADHRTNVLIVRGTAEQLQKAGQIIETVDAAASPVAERTESYHVRLFWVGEVAEDQEAMMPDMENVGAELKAMGLDHVSLIGSLAVGVVHDSRFQISGMPDENSDMTLTGILKRRPSDVIELQVQIACAEIAPRPLTPAEATRRAGQLDIQTTITLPLNHYVVLGVAPSQSRRSALVLYVTER